ncbi:MAG: ATP-binding protein [Thermodesulfobacteriota bacterium]
MRIRNPFRTLQSKFTLYLSILIFGIMSMLAFWNISREKRLIQEVIIREGKALIESLAISCTNTILYEEIGLVEEGGLLDNYISDLMQRKDLNIIYAMILDPKGKVIAHHSIKEIGNTYHDEHTQKALTSSKTLLQYPSDEVLDLSTPLAISTKRWGTLRIGISLASLKKETFSLVIKYILYTGLFILLGIMVIAFLFRVITKPLKLLSHEMDEAKWDGQFSHPSIVEEDEIGILRKSFYRLLQRIKEDEKEREKTQRNLILTEKMVAIGKLTSGIAHEINNPLGGLLNCIYHFKRGDLPPERQKEYWQLMEDGIKRIQKTVTNLLEYAQTPHIERTPTDLRSIIDKSLSLLDYEIKKKKIKVIKEIPEELPMLEVDKNQISQVFINLFLNSVQAMGEEGILRISTGFENGQLTIAISDTGKGIPKEILPKVFDPFFTTKGAEKGTGLGLWITQGIVERHGGTIHLFSEEGKGTTVEIRIPTPAT